MSYLITAEALFQQLHEVQLLEVGAKTAESTDAEIALQHFLNGHIATAQYVDLARDFSNLCTALHYQCPNQAELVHSLQKFGLDFSKPIVIYDRENHIWAARLFWVLQAFGHRNVKVLHGGFKAWQDSAYPLIQGQASALQQFSSPQLQFNPNYFADLAQVKHLVEHKTDSQLLNVLRRVVFRGEEQRYQRAGHIPKSINLPFAEFLDELGQFKTFSSDFWASLELDLNREVIVYCGSGITASGAALALLEAHASNVKIYDGSMSEWTADPKLPLTVLN